MEIPSDVLNRLVCDNCEGHLSRGPVLILDNGHSKCGRCFEPEDGCAHRNLPYEELAKLMVFPCRYTNEGCQETLKFEDNKEHEEACAFRLFVCPIASSGQCEWSGGRGSLLDHCRVQHPDNIVANPFQLVHDIIKSSLHNYLLSAFQVLFLIQTKVCVSSRKLYHSVRLIGDAKYIASYAFDIDTENNGKKLTIPGKVTEQGCMALQEDASVSMDINGLILILGDFRDTMFKVTVRSTDAQVLENSATTSTANITGVNVKEQVRVQVECYECKTLEEPGYREEWGWLCTGCAPTIQLCRNSFQGCTYREVSDKCRKHEQYHCAYSIQNILLFKR